MAQAAGIRLSFGRQLLMVFTLMLTSTGVAGVPRAALVILLTTAASFNLPVEPIFIILGIDELMNVARTSTNLIGTYLATVVVARREGELGTGQPSEVIQASEPGGPRRGGARPAEQHRLPTRVEPVTTPVSQPVACPPGGTALAR